MAKAYRHAEISVKKWGGAVNDYLPIHEKMDSVKMVHADVRHRLIFHSAFGIYLIQDIFGQIIENSDGKSVCVRDIAEQHVLDDLGYIPSLNEWMDCVSMKPWMAGLHTKKIEFVD